jgi:hypothetical protein
MLKFGNLANEGAWLKKPQFSMQDMAIWNLAMCTTFQGTV